MVLRQVFLEGYKLLEKFYLPEDLTHLHGDLFGWFCPPFGSSKTYQNDIPTWRRSCFCSVLSSLRPQKRRPPFNNGYVGTMFLVCHVSRRFIVNKLTKTPCSNQTNSTDHHMVLQTHKPLKCPVNSGAKSNPLALLCGIFLFHRASIRLQPQHTQEVTALFLEYILVWPLSVTLSWKGDPKNTARFLVGGLKPFRFQKSFTKGVGKNMKAPPN